MIVFRSILIFTLAGICEIGGGYLVWSWLRDGKSLAYGILGGVVLAAYGVVATLQQANFGRVYATYGGIFIVMSIFWGWKVDNVTPDRYDLVGAGIALVGVAIMYFAPRSS